MDYRHLIKVGIKPEMLKNSAIIVNFAQKNHFFDTFLVKTFKIRPFSQK